MFWNRTFLYVYILRVLRLKFSSCYTTLSVAQDCCFVFQKHALYWPGATLFTAYTRCAKIRSTEIYVPRKQRFLYDFLLTICAVCFERGRQHFEQFCTSSLTLSAVNKVVFSCNVSTMPVKRLSTSYLIYKPRYRATNCGEQWRYIYLCMAF
jgi:hypothetical protein